MTGLSRKVIVESRAAADQEAAVFGLGPLMDNVFSRRDTLCDFDRISVLRRVFHHHHRVRAWRHRSAGHDGECFALIQGGWSLQRAGFDLSHHGQLGR